MASIYDNLAENYAYHRYVGTEMDLLRGLEPDVLQSSADFLQLNPIAHLFIRYACLYTSYYFHGDHYCFTLDLTYNHASAEA